MLTFTEGRRVLRDVVCAVANVHRCDFFHRDVAADKLREERRDRSAG